MDSPAESARTPAICRTDGAGLRYVATDQSRRSRLRDGCLRLHHRCRSRIWYHHDAVVVGVDHSSRNEYGPTKFQNDVTLPCTGLAALARIGSEGLYSDWQG